MHKIRAQNVGVTLDECPDHGAWFDRDELDTIAAVVRGAQPRVPSIERTAGEFATAGLAAAAATTAHAAMATNATREASLTPLEQVAVAGKLSTEAINAFGIVVDTTTTALEAAGQVIAGVFSLLSNLDV